MLQPFSASVDRRSRHVLAFHIFTRIMMKYAIILMKIGPILIKPIYVLTVLYPTYRDFLMTLYTLNVRCHRLYQLQLHHSMLQSASVCHTSIDHYVPICLLHLRPMNKLWETNVIKVIFFRTFSHFPLI